VRSSSARAKETRSAAVPALVRPTYSRIGSIAGSSMTDAIRRAGVADARWRRASRVSGAQETAPPWHPLTNGDVGGSPSTPSGTEISASTRWVSQATAPTRPAVMAATEVRWLTTAPWPAAPLTRWMARSATCAMLRSTDAKATAPAAVAAPTPRDFSIGARWSGAGSMPAARSRWTRRCCMAAETPVPIPTIPGTERTATPNRVSRPGRASSAPGSALASDAARIRCAPVRTSARAIDSSSRCGSAAWTAEATAKATTSTASVVRAVFRVSTGARARRSTACDPPSTMSWARAVSA